MPLTWTKVIYLAVLTLFTFLLVGHALRNRRQKVIRSLSIQPLEVFLMAAWGFGLALPLGYFFSDWLSAADYSLPSWVSWAGAIVCFLALLLLAAAHRDLGENWTSTVKIRSGHTLVTNGVYALMRHPVYAAHLLLSAGILLLIPNFFAAPLALTAMGLLAILRIPQEEELLLEVFGQQYRDYCSKVGVFWPLWHLRQGEIRAADGE